MKPDLLRSLLDRLDHDVGQSVVLTGADLRHWPAEQVAALQACGLLRPSTPVSWLKCPGCYSDHDVDLEQAETPAGPALFVYCPEAGHILIGADRVATWQVNMEPILSVTARTLRIDGTSRERRRGRAWSLGRGNFGGDYVEVWVLKGCRDAAARAFFQDLPLPPNAWVFGTRSFELESGLAVRPLADYLAIAGGVLTFDLRQLARELKAATGVERRRNVFRQVGEGWLVGLNVAEGVLVQHVKGMADIHELLAHPGRFIAAALLAASADGTREDKAVRNQRGIPLTDAATLAEVRARLSEDISEEERQKLQQYLGQTVGTNGVRAPGGALEAARTTVTNRIRNAFKRIARADPDLAQHLREHVETGKYLSYRPSEPPLEWDL